ncbi:hypothetical protein ACK56M_14510 [Pseudomonas sp. s4]|uniref:Uncharacterized protein n=1 Tax=Pseudomonas plecoglossicida TaxID=70775 RepID=A0ABX4U5Z7_PSEDL|nr:hypothetical protein [Pseudomonas plecoglossicida]PLU85057.1 hypothetical protein CXG44_23180 [Pseudomonas plecoglossicida]PLU90899.1 hypothetical protein CXG45_21810 [Pseudomonas plecoglossicida]PLV01434.1 hypothetical protein CXG48_20300 [Pseudomonas plecoglossicida]PLV16579.1 hypothetical protein CXG47_00025 [Pseudomonas plecoglossicida]
MADLVEGERQLRRLLWALSALHPGDPKAKAVLQELHAVEGGLDDVHQSCRYLLSLVNTTTHSSGRKIVDELTIPTPWRERFDQASVGSTRLAAGPYLDDLEKFVDEWELEMKRLKAHREALRRS